MTASRVPGRGCSSGQRSSNPLQRPVYMRRCNETVECEHLVSVGGRFGGCGGSAGCSVREERLDYALSDPNTRRVSGAARLLKSARRWDGGRGSWDRVSAEPLIPAATGP